MRMSLDGHERLEQGLLVIQHWCLALSNICVPKVCVVLVTMGKHVTCSIY